MTVLARARPTCRYNVAMRGFVIIAIAACGSLGPGAYVDVHTGDPRVATVELFLGTGPCGPTDSPCAITPPTQAGALRVGSAGGAWYRDADGIVTAPVHNRTATVRIEPGDQPIVQLVVVGLDANLVPIASGRHANFAVPQIPNEVDIVPIELGPAMVADPTEEIAPQHPDGNFVQLWNTNPQAACVLDERWQNGQATRTFVGPSADPDCDGLDTFLDPAMTMPNPLECNPLWYMRPKAGAVQFDQSDCAVPTTTTANLPACVLGGPPCFDGSGPAGDMCKPVGPVTCLTQSTCDSCGGKVAAIPLSACLRPTQHTWVHCIIAEDLLGGPCASVASPASGLVNLDGLFPGLAHNCTDIRFSQTDSLGGVQQRSMLTLGSADFDVQSLSPTGCTFDLVWNGGKLPPGLATQQNLLGVIVDNGNQMLLELRIDAQACSVSATGIDCHLFYSAGDDITNCAK